MVFAYGLPESVHDLEDAVHTLMQDLIPEIAPHHLEIDRVHRALTAPRPDGLPRDVIVKPHYYRIKEKIMWETRSRGDISLLGHSVQLFAYISQLTIQKRRSLKPLLTHLVNRHIKEILLELGLISRDPSSTSPQQGRDRPISPIFPPNYPLHRWELMDEPASSEIFLSFAQ